MTGGVRVAAFGALLVAIFALAALAGRSVEPSTEAEPEAAAHADAAADHGEDAAAPPKTSALAIAAGDTTLTARRAERLRFTIRDAGGATVRDFETEQGRRMHLIVVRRDLRRFQHLHPTQDATGAWSTRLTLPDAGVYHAFADFQTGGRRQALGVDLFAAGPFAPLPLPAGSPTARTGGYAVTLAAAEDATLRFAVRRGGAPVNDLQPYLGAKGHLVMLRAGDLAYEHVHPLPAAGALAFQTADAQPGTYRLFVQFRHRDAVHTAAFTHTVRR
jgi:hypothetical protein